jgi:hypothetical protein
VALGSARPSVTKKQREQKKRERKLAKAEKRAQRKTAAQSGITTEEPFDDTPLDGPAPAEEEAS